MSEPRQTDFRQLLNAALKDSAVLVYNGRKLNETEAKNARLALHRIAKMCEAELSSRTPV